MPAITAVCVILVFLPCGTGSGPCNRSDFKEGWPPSGSRAASAPWIERGRPTGGHEVNVPSGLDYSHGSRHKDRPELRNLSRLSKLGGPAQSTCARQCFPPLCMAP